MGACRCCLSCTVYMSQLVASDVLWSDPSTKPGQVLNNQRFVGTRFGPDVTEVCLHSARATQQASAAAFMRCRRCLAHAHASELLQTAAPSWCPASAR